MPSPYQVLGGIDVRASYLAGTIHIHDANDHVVTGALVMLNNHILHYNSFNESYCLGMSQTHNSMGTQVSLQIWLNDPQTPLIKGMAPSRPPDISATGTVSNWLTPVFPVHGGVYNLALNPSPTFTLTWTFSGASEKTYIRLEGPLFSSSTRILDDVGVAQPSIQIPSAKMRSGDYSLMYTVIFPFPLKSRFSLTANSHLTFYYKTYLDFHIQ